MLKKLLIPFFVISVAAVASNGCSSSSTPAKDGGAGKGTAGAGGGTAGAGGGTAGADAGTAGTAGADAGTAGAAGADAGTAGADAATTDAGTAGADAATIDAGTAGVDGATSGLTLTALEAECVGPTGKVTAANSATPYAPEDFCKVYLAVCGTTTFDGALTETDCVATYTSWATKKVTGMPTVGVQNCTSYHLCNAYNGGIAGATTVHCPHAAATASSAICAPAN
ncbi:MAG TPA: hypothetical protein VLA14_02140 [Polyangia bacterium]|nr:hypothetical protein [Polyangia bacterium]